MRLDLTLSNRHRAAVSSHNLRVPLAPAARSARGRMITAASTSRCFTAIGESTDRRFEPLPINRLREVERETRIRAGFHILLHPVAAERYADDAVPRAQFHHEFRTACIRQAEVTDEKLKSLVRREAERILDGAGSFNPVSGLFEQPPENATRGVVVFDEQDVQ